MDLPIDQIRTDGGTQSRALISGDTVAEYADAMADPDVVFPPVVVYHDGREYWLADGFHRLEAWRRIGRAEIPTDIRQGDRRRAILHSVAANSTHGLRRTNDDKRRAVMTLLEDDEWWKWPDAEIARRCGVGRNFVRKLREESTCTRSASEPAPVYRKYIDKHGKERTMNVARIGSGNPKARPLTHEEASLLTEAESPSVYVLQSGQRCKIGWSRDVKHRVKTLLGQNPDGTVVAIGAGGLKQERQVHKFLDCERDVGEWFIVTPENAIEAMQRAGLNVVSRISKVGSSRDDEPSPVHKPASPTAAADKAGISVGKPDGAEARDRIGTPADGPAPNNAPDDSVHAEKLGASNEHDPHRAGLSGLTRPGLEDEVAGLRAENADLRDRVAKQRSDIADLKARVKELSADNKGATIAGLQKRLEAANYRRDEAMRVAKREEYKRKQAEKRLADLEQVEVPY